MASKSVARSESIAAFIPDLELLIAEAMDEWKIPGLAVAVVQNGEVALVRGYGFRDVEAGLKVTTDTQFLIGSITKSFTSTGLALLMDERRLDWKKPVRDYVPEFRLHDTVATTASRCAICSAIIPGSRAMIGFGCQAICHPRKCWRQCVI
jgi:CubicO group peptidase (beta-lactamase class C family)